VRKLGFWLRTKPARVHTLLATLIAVNVIALFLVSWPAGLTLQATSLLVALVFAIAYRWVGAS
jgi:hypothetical protein